MLSICSPHKLEQVEAALCRAAQQHGAHILAVQPLGELFSGEARQGTRDAISFSVCHFELYRAMLAADVRFSLFLPCRIAAIRDEEGVSLVTVSPKLFCRHLNRSDLDRLVAPLETLLRTVMGDAAKASSLRVPQPHVTDSALGAREGQVSVRGPIPQRIDCRGTKIEDLAGTGEPDAPGG